MELVYYKPKRYKKPTFYDCPHNEGCRCKVKDCYHCGWNPKVAEYRMDRIMKKMGVKTYGKQE